MALREFVYFDRQKIIDFLSSLDKGLSQSKRELIVKESSKLSGQIGVPGVGIGGSRGGGRLEFEELKMETPASLFEKLYEMLEKSHSIQSLSKAKVGDIIEQHVSIELSGKDVLADIMEGIIPLVEKQSAPTLDTKNLEMIKAIIQNLASKGVTVIMTPLNDPPQKIVADLQHDRIRVSRSELVGDYVALCRIQRILKVGEAFDLFRIIHGMKLPPQAYEGLSQMQHPLWNVNLSKEKFELGYPGRIVTAVVIYR